MCDTDSKDRENLNSGEDAIFIVLVAGDDQWRLPPTYKLRSIGL